MSNPTWSHSLDQQHEQLFNKSISLIQDYTCPITGLPTPDRQQFLTGGDIDPYVKCARGIWGVSSTGAAINIEQEYRVLDSAQPEGAEAVKHLGVCVVLFCADIVSPVRVRHGTGDGYDASRSYKGFAVYADIPYQGSQSSYTGMSYPGSLVYHQPADDRLQEISGKMLDVLDANPFTWFIPYYRSLGLELSNVPGTDLSLGAIEGDNRIMVAEIDLSNDPSASEAEQATEPYRQTVPSRNSRYDAGQYIARDAEALHAWMKLQGAVDISKL